MRRLLLGVAGLLGLAIAAVTGWVMPTSPLSFEPVAYHPTAEAMQAIASALAKTLKP